MNGADSTPEQATSAATAHTQPTQSMNAIQRLKEHPRGFWFVFWGELAERASYYGMRTLLALYLLDVFHFTKGESGEIVQMFMATCYILPLVGGWISDHYLGKYKTILYFSVPYIAGHFILGFSNSRTLIFVALGFLAMGSGAIKPNTSTLMGLIYEKAGKQHLLTEAFSYFYAAINIGSTFTTFFLPTIRDHFGYAVAFMFPTVLMVAAFFLFAAGKKEYPVEDLKARPPKTREQRREEWQTLGRVGGIFALIALFWWVYDQSASTWIFLARDHMNLRLWPFSITVSPDQVQGFNPLFIVIFTPFFNWLWGYIERKTGKPFPSTRKMIIGFVLTAICTGSMAMAAFLSRSGPVSVWWEVLATTVVVLAELCISVVGMEFAYTVASEQTKAIVTAAFWFTVFVGDSLGAVQARYYDQMDPTIYFGLQVVLLLFASVTFFFVGRRFEAKYVRRGDEAEPKLA